MAEGSPRGKRARLFVECGEEDEGGYVDSELYSAD